MIKTQLVGLLRRPTPANSQPYLVDQDLLVIAFRPQRRKGTTSFLAFFSAVIPAARGHPTALSKG